MRFEEKLLALANARGAERAPESVGGHAATVEAAAAAILAGIGNHNIGSSSCSGGGGSGGGSNHQQILQNGAIARRPERTGPAKRHPTKHTKYSRRLFGVDE